MQFWKVLRTEGFVLVTREAAFFFFFNLKETMTREWLYNVNNNLQTFHNIKCAYKWITIVMLINKFKKLHLSAICYAIRGIKHFWACCHYKIVNCKVGSHLPVTDYFPITVLLLMQLIFHLMLLQNGLLQNSWIRKLLNPIHRDLKTDFISKTFPEKSFFYLL